MEELLREVLSGSRMLHFEGTKKDEAPLVEAAGRAAVARRAAPRCPTPGAGIRAYACFGARIRAYECPPHAFLGNPAPIYAFAGNPAPAQTPAPARPARGRGIIPLAGGSLQRAPG